ncbi:kinesin-like protein KIN-14L isoform X1 [Punica granatum]|uniref:Kinesin-like protein KIN-14L isoform X1 n=1 Tax=Punica granatum TaxID=22663 RepID=A0A6P8DJS5_PUNGR|nr:kinesin-like protein KIN-14L isoform X1 [Punica granatum]
MEDSARSGLHDINLASRKAEEAAWRRYQAAGWLDSLVGPLGLPGQPSEREFISCLRNGQVLCNAINKIYPGAVSKVVENNPAQLSVHRETQPLPAYQYFENVRNFLVAMEELKLPAFEASDLERHNLEAGSSAKLVDCILGLKAYHENKQLANSGNGRCKHLRSPLVKHSAGRIHSWAPAPSSSDSCRRLEMSTASEKPPNVSEMGILEESIVRLLANSMVEAKENFDGKLLSTFSNGNMATAKDPVKLFSKIISTCLDDPQISVLNSFFENYTAKRDRPLLQSTSSAQEDHSNMKSKCCRTCLRKGNCNHGQRFQMQERELSALKNLLSKARTEFEDLQSQLQQDLKELGAQVQEMSTAALGYYQVVKENRNLYNMVQDLKGNIRVYCRIRPIFNDGSVVDFIGQDGSLVISDPSKPQREGRKTFKFNKVFGPTSTQGEVFADIQPLIRSVMDGYNVCIFAYGQTGSGKTHTMSGPLNGSTKDLGINYLALSDLFQLSSMRKDITDYDIRVQMVEIYNEQVRDLLHNDSSTTKLEIRSCTADGGLSLPDATMHSVKSTADVVKLMKLGDENRVVSSTALNNRSSRSHSVLTVHVSGKDISGSTLRSCLHLVDLAGSERVDKSEVTGERLKEAQYINKSLSCLGDVITTLAQKNSHIPYRNSKLTLLLQDSLGGHAKTLMFAHVNPEVDSFGETVSTLKFAQRVSTVELGAARMNKESSEVLQLKEQVENLKKALANKESRSAQLSKTTNSTSPVKKPTTMPERTPPRPRRLSIENCRNSTAEKNETAVNHEERKATKTPVSIRSRRLSIEGPRSIKKDDLPTRVTKEATLTQRNENLQERDVVSKSYGYFSQSVSGSNEGYHQQTKAIRSPTSVSNRKQVAKTESRQRVSTLQVLKTPEPIVQRNRIPLVMQSEVCLSTDPETPTMMVSSTTGKGSQIRKSFKTIGKLINGSEKRHQRISVEACSPIRGTSVTSSNGRASRRQSLTGIPLPGEIRSRRSSIGGKPIESSDVNDETRNAKTPPTVHSSSTTTKRWL